MNNNKNKNMEAKLHSSSVYGDTVRKIAGIVTDEYGYCLTNKCRHFDTVKFKCDKIHHCDCDCPECSPESYI